MKASGIDADGSYIRDNQSIPATAAFRRSAGQPTRPGAIGGAVLQASRRRAGLNCRNLARLLAVTPAIVKRWQDGTFPLYAVDFRTLRRLADVTATDVRELLIAQQCDLLVTRMLAGDEDFADVPPIDENIADGETARGLLRWAFTGQVPVRWRQLARSRPLIAAADADRIACLACQLAAGGYGQDLTGYGAVLLRCTNRAQPHLSQGTA